MFYSIKFIDILDKMTKMPTENVSTETTLYG